MISPDHDIRAAIAAAFHADAPARLGVAVSGGGDSVALLHALARYFQESETQVLAATVNHGLRDGAAQEAAQVAQLAARLGLAHETLHWEGWSSDGNLQDRARAARYDLLSAWAGRNDLSVIALGHTADDQAETVLMRLARGSGVDGLSGMRARRLSQGVLFVRPFLGLQRDRLRDYLRDHAVSWIEDPSNEDPRFDRIRWRQAAPALEALGLGTEVLGEIAQHMARARDALDWYTFLAARDIVQIDGGNVLIDARQFRTQPQETARRLLQSALRWVSSAAYPPRKDALAAAVEAVRSGQTATLHGCIIVAQDGLAWICREYNAVKTHSVFASETWDSRWQIQGPARTQADLRIRALGPDGLAQCPRARDTGRPRAALLSSVSVWAGDRVVAAPCAGVDSLVDIALLGGAEDFFASILSH